METAETRQAIEDEVAWMEGARLSAKRRVAGRIAAEAEAEARAEAEAAAVRNPARKLDKLQLTHFEVETDEANGRWRVNSWTPDPKTMKPVKVAEGPWGPMPPKDVRHEFANVLGANRPQPEGAGEG